MKTVAKWTPTEDSSGQTYLCMRSVRCLAKSQASASPYHFHWPAHACRFSSPTTGVSMSDSGLLRPAIITTPVFLVSHWPAFTCQSSSYSTDVPISGGGLVRPALYSRLLFTTIWREIWLSRCHALGDPYFLWMIHQWYVHCWFLCAHPGHYSGWVCVVFVWFFRVQTKYLFMTNWLSESEKKKKRREFFFKERLLASLS